MTRSPSLESKFTSPSNCISQLEAFNTRAATSADAPGIARVHVDSWRTTYKGIVADDTLAGLSYERRQQYWDGVLENPDPGIGMFVVEGAEGIVGFAAAGPERGGDVTRRGEVYAIYLLEKAQGLGMGKALMRAACAHLLAQDSTSMLLWVLKDNLPARKFYEALGGKYLREKTIEIGTQSMVEVAYGWDDLKTLAKE